MSEQQRRQQRDRYYADLAAKARLSMTFVTTLTSVPPSSTSMAVQNQGQYAHTTLAQPRPQSHALYAGDSVYPLPQSQATEYHAEHNAPVPTGDCFEPDAAKQISFLLTEVNRLEKLKNTSEENAKYWHNASEKASKLLSILEGKKAAQEQKMNVLELQLKGEQESKLALTRRLNEYREPQGRSSLSETLDLKESELLNLQGKMKELRFHNSALKSQIEELRHEKGPQTDLELAREIQHIRSEVERLSTQNEILQKQLANQELRSHELWPLQEGAGEKEDPYALLDTAFK